MGVIVCFDQRNVSCAVPCRSCPTKRIEARSERSDEVRDCKLHVRQTKEYTKHRLKTVHDTD